MVQAAKLNDTVDYLIVRRQKKHQDPNQHNFLNELFLDYDVWIQGAIETAVVMGSRGPFYFSELRAKLVNPHHPNAWGTLAKALMKNGFKRTGEYRRSKIGSRKGGLDWQYERKDNGRF